ncbi:hypothetical protein [Rhizobium johnstonii]|uniref:hypothetical protein n=1 Tax=Rhizobium johnstonii TaxID=3019933 RepID=UPI003F9B12DF
MPALDKREVASSIAARRLPLRFRDLETNEIRDPIGAFEKTDMIEMLDKPEDIAFRIAERIKPSAPLMRDDDDFTTTAKLDCPPGAFLDVDGEPRLFKNGRAAHLLTQRLYLSSFHFAPDRTAIGLHCLSLPVASWAPFGPPRRAKTARARLAIVGSCNARPRRSLPCGLLLASGTPKAGSMRRPGEKFMSDLKVVVGIDLVRGKDAVFTLDFKDGDRTIRSWELEGAGLCEEMIERV